MSLRETKGFFEGVMLPVEGTHPFMHKDFALKVNEREIPVPQHLSSHSGKLFQPPCQGSLAALAGLPKSWGSSSAFFLSQTVKQWVNHVCSSLETESLPAMCTHPCLPRKTVGPAIQHRHDASEQEDSSRSCVFAHDRQERQSEIRALPKDRVEMG